VFGTANANPLRRFESDSERGRAPRLRDFQRQRPDLLPSARQGHRPRRWPLPEPRPTLQAEHRGQSRGLREMIDQLHLQGRFLSVPQELGRQQIDRDVGNGPKSLLTLPDPTNLVSCHHRDHPFGDVGWKIDGDRRAPVSVGDDVGEPASGVPHGLLGRFALALECPQPEVRLLQKRRVAVALEFIRIESSQVQAGQWIEKVEHPRPQFALHRIDRPIDDGNRQFRLRRRGTVSVLDLEIDLQRFQRFGLGPFRKHRNIQTLRPGNDPEAEGLLPIFATARGDRDRMIKPGPVLRSGFNFQPAAPSLDGGRSGVVNLPAGDRFPDRPAFRLTPVCRKQRKDLRLLARAQGGARCIEFELLVLDHRFSLTSPHDHNRRLRGSGMLHRFAIKGFESRDSGQPAVMNQLGQSELAQTLGVGGKGQLYEGGWGLPSPLERNLDHTTTVRGWPAVRVGRTHPEGVVFFPRLRHAC